MDLEGVIWLSNQLKQHIGDTMVLMVSHDAAFLDAVATDVIHFQLKRLAYYPGNYSAFMKARGSGRGRNIFVVSLVRGRKMRQSSVRRIKMVLGEVFVL